MSHCPGPSRTCVCIFSGPQASGSDERICANLCAGPALSFCFQQKTQGSRVLLTSSSLSPGWLNSKHAETSAISPSFYRMGNWNLTRLHDSTKVTQCLSYRGGCLILKTNPPLLHWLTQFLWLALQIRRFQLGGTERFFRRIWSF